MRITNTVKRLAFYATILLSAFFIFYFASSYAENSKLKEAKDAVAKSQEYYQRAVKEYQGLIAEGRDPDQLYFELGKLYYEHGNFSEAVEALKKSGDGRARKFLALAYYRMGNFTDAREIFNKEDSSGDSEYLYYYGLTCEKLNLFDKALDIYRKIKDPVFALLGAAQINLIEKQVNTKKIKEISPEIAALIEASPAQEAYPQAGALILFCDEKVELTGQNTEVDSLHYLVKILNTRGKEDFSETHIEYDSTDEKVELISARTIKPDGTVVDVGARHIRDVSKYLNFPLYSNVRVYIISFPEITEGACIEYKLKIYKNELINKKDFVLSYPLQTQEPVISANFILDLPQEKTVHLKVLNERYNNFSAEANPKIETRENRRIYSWQFKNIPQIIPEANMPPPVEINPAILISTFSSWDEIYQWWWKLAKDKIKADSAIKEKVRELIKDKDSPKAKARSIYNFCAQKIRYVAVEYGEAGYEPHAAADIFKNKYGDCKDQAILLVTMLKEALLSAWPLLIPTKDYYNLNPDYPSVLFNHSIAAVSLDDKIIFLDPTAETCSFGDLPAADQNRKVLVCKEDKYMIENTPLYPAAHNLVKQELKIKVNQDETIAAKKDIFTSGVYEQVQRHWLLYTPPQLIEEALKEKIQEISIGAKLQGYEVKNLEDLNQPVLLSYALEGPEYFTVAGTLRIMPQLASVDTALVAKDRRNYPIDFDTLDSRETLIEFSIPDDFGVKYIPESVNEDSPWLKFSAEYYYKENKLLFRQRAELKDNLVTQADYPAFKKFFENLARKIKQRVILEKIK